MSKPLFVTGNSTDSRLVAVIGDVLQHMQPSRILVDIDGPFSPDSFEGIEAEESSLPILLSGIETEGENPDALVLFDPTSSDPFGKKAIAKLRKFSPLVRVLIPGVGEGIVNEKLFIKDDKKHDGLLLSYEEYQAILSRKPKARVHQEALFEGDMKVTRKVKKAAKPKLPKDLRSMFRRHLAGVTEDSLKKEWMAQKSFRLIKDPTELQKWCTTILEDKSRHQKVYGAAHDEMLPVIAVDTETIGLDTRILVHIEEDKSYDPPVHYAVYEVKIEIAGICISPDGIEGIYIPINHSDGQNMPRELCTSILQDFFNKSHLVFYNAKFDREVLKLTMGIEMRGYPYFEDVQVLQYINDPKADLGDKGKNQFTGDAGGLKALSESILGIEQVKMDAIGKVKADFYNAEKHKKNRFEHPDWDEEKCRTKAISQRIQYVPFTWIPTNLALWYAAGDAICTWLLWEKAKEEARSRKLVHHIDHELVDTLAWVERQRYMVATDKLARSISWHRKKLDVMADNLRVMALAEGWKEPSTDEGVIIDKFNIDSNDDVRKLLYEIKKLDIVKKTDTGNASTDKDAMLDLLKKYPNDAFLKEYASYKKYVALHPDNLRFDPHDKSARVYLKQCVVAGGRLAATGGDFDVDGGFGLNIQGIKRVEGNWWVRGNVLVPDAVPEDQIEEYTEADLHKSCFKKEDKEIDGVKTKVNVKAPGIIKNHIGHYLGYAICLVPKCTSCAEKHGILIPKTRMDANQVVNLRSLFVAPEGWTFFTTDYCLAPATRLLTRDLRWKPSGETQIGDELYGFDEQIPTKGGRRKLRHSVVENVKRVKLPSVRITTESGKVLVCCEQHGWLTSRTEQTRLHWRVSKDLKPGDCISRFCHTWEEDTSREAGYLAGVYDGEASVGFGPSLGFGQKSGLVWDKTRSLLQSKGFAFGSGSNKKTDVNLLWHTGGRSEILRFLGSVRPGRLIKNVEEKLIGRGVHNHSLERERILSVELIGEQELVAIQTSTKTFIAEGLLSHNCNIEMRCAANVSKEPEFIKEFMEGSGDFHALTASKVFPAFNDPTTPKDIKKALRSLAKIINFALLYGGTEYTIFENMKKQKPDITWDECKIMVANYWAGVPTFRLWCDGQQNTAKTEMYCQTATGRIVKFESAMEALHIHKPTSPEMDNMWQYRALQRQGKQLKDMGEKDQAAAMVAQADRLWHDPDTGVRNALDFQRFMGKIQRVAVNTPLQGLAGDFMRIALNRIRIWACSKDPLVQSVLRCHGSVHDEIDYAVKNEYAPFVIPRVTRLMKLRKYHEQRQWPVPIECDTEYAQSWDVEHHLTGDDGHSPSGWTEIKGMENYLPAEFDMATVDMLAKAAMSGDKAKIDKAMVWLKANLHERAFDVIHYAFEEKELPEIKKHLIAALQLHEYWTVDNVPDGKDEELETLEQYEARCGLTPRNRGYMPEMGFLGAVPLDHVRRPTLPILGEEVPAENVEIMIGTDTINVQTQLNLQEASVVNELENEIMDIKAGAAAREEAVVAAAAEAPVQQPAVKPQAAIEAAIVAVVQADEEDPFLQLPLTVVKPAPAQAQTVAVETQVTVVIDEFEGYPELRPGLTTEDIKRLRIALGFGSNVVRYRIKSTKFAISSVKLTQIPSEFLR